MTPARRRLRLRLVFMCAFKWRRPTLPYFSLPVAVTRTRFFTLLFVLFLLAMIRNSVRGSGSRSFRLRFPVALVSEATQRALPAAELVARNVAGRDARPTEKTRNRDCRGQ